MEKDMQIELRKEKLIASLEKGTVVMLTLNDDTGVSGVVERNVLCCEGNYDNWHELTISVGGHRVEINSKNIKEIKKCIPKLEDNNKIVGKDGFEIYGIEFGLSDVDFLKSVLYSWSDIEDEGKEEITDIIAASLTGEILRDIFGAYAVLKNQNTELHDKLMDSYTEKARLINEKDSPDVLKSLNNFIVGSVIVLGLASAISNIED